MLAAPSFTVDRVGPTRPAHMLPNTWYHIQGHHDGKALPDQFIFTVAPPIELNVNGLIYAEWGATWVIPAWVFIDLHPFGVIFQHQARFPLNSVNVQEHGDTDHHIIRTTINEVVKEAHYRAAVAFWQGQLRRGEIKL